VRPRSARWSHQVRILNLDSHEMWLPFPDSLRFDWQVPREAALEHWFIDKGRELRRRSERTTTA